MFTQLNSLKTLYKIIIPTCWLQSYSYIRLFHDSCLLARLQRKRKAALCRNQCKFWMESEICYAKYRLYNLMEKAAFDCLVWLITLKFAEYKRFSLAFWTWKILIRSLSGICGLRTRINYCMPKHYSMFLDRTKKL